MATSPITTQDVLDQVNDFVANYTTGSIDVGNRLRAINRAIEYVQRRMSLPSDKRMQTILYADDNHYYNLNSDFNEPLQVIYQNNNNNNEKNKWVYRPDDEIIQRLGQWDREKMFSTTTINGSYQLLMKGSNIAKGSTLVTFDQLGSIVGQNDATSLAIDNNVYKEGSGSLSFTIDPTKGNGKASIYIPVNWNVFQNHNQLAYYKVYAYLPSIAFSSINLVLGTDATNYYVFTTTTQDGGTAWSANTWNLLSWTFNQPPTIVGSPSDTNITYARIDFVESGFGSSPISGFRVDDLYSKFPDQMNFVYLSNYKAYAADGTTLKFLINAATDIPLFGYYVPDLLNPVALRAAYILNPQLRGDKDFMQQYKQDCEDVIAIWAKVYPRRRVVNMGKTILDRS